VSLSAGGTIGTATDALEIVVTGAYGGDATDDDVTGTVTATAQGDIAISAVERNLNVRRIASASGDVFLRAELGSILDAEYNPGGIQGGADVIGNSIDLYARVAIGQAGNELDIDSSSAAAGRVRAFTDLESIYLA